MGTLVQNSGINLTGYHEFKIGAILKLAREKSGMIQDEVARKVKTKKRNFKDRKSRRRHEVAGMMIVLDVDDDFLYGKEKRGKIRSR
jgi:hypothetical protein